MKKKAPLHPIPTLFLGYDVNPLLEKKVFTSENRVLNEYPYKAGIWSLFDA